MVVGGRHRQNSWAAPGIDARWLASWTCRRDEPRRSSSVPAPFASPWRWIERRRSAPQGDATVKNERPPWLAARRPSASVDHTRERNLHATDRSLRGRGPWRLAEIADAAGMPRATIDRDVRRGTLGALQVLYGAGQPPGQPCHFVTATHLRNSPLPCYRRLVRPPPRDPVGAQSVSWTIKADPAGQSAAQGTATDNNIAAPARGARQTASLRSALRRMVRDCTNSVRQ